MSPGAKLSVILGGLGAVVFSLRWLLHKLVGPPPANRETPPRDGTWPEVTHHHDQGPD